MYADPEVRSLLDHLIAQGRPSSMSLPLAEGRANFSELFVSVAEPETYGEAADSSVPGAAGDIAVRLYRPGGSAGGGPLPVVAFFHGGGWVFGDLHSHDPMCRGLVRHSGAMVVAVDYRRAPEHGFPAPLEDCIAVVEHLKAHGRELGGDPSRLAVAGDSSGANLAAGVALALRASSALRFQLLLYPALDPRMSSASYEENATDDFLSAAEMQWYWSRYLGASVDEPSPLAGPALAPDLSGLPPAYIAVAGNDPLRDDGVVYAARLASAGVPVQLDRYDEMVHGFASFTKWLGAGRRGLEAAGRALAEALQEDRVGSEQGGSS